MDLVEERQKVMILRKEKFILSFTSHKTRLPLIDDIFRSHVNLCEKLGLSLSFSCQDDSIPYMTEYQKSLVSNGTIELLHVPKDDGSNTKWTLCREAHKDAVMIVVDDDWTYDVEGIRSLIETHERFPEAVVCRAYRSIPWIGEELPLYQVKPQYSYPKTVTAHIKVNRKKDNVSDEEKVIAPGMAYPEHFLGVLYPKGFPMTSKDSIPIECLKDDDVFIGGCIASENRDLVFAGRRRMSLDKEKNLPDALWANSRAINGLGTFMALKSIYKDLVSKISGKLGSVFLLTCKNYPKRRESIRKELERVGIGYTEVYDDGTFMPEIVYTHKHLNRCHLAKYRALKIFLENPTERITIIEDDIRFLNDINEIANAIDTIPIDFGACRLSWAPSPYIRKEMESTRPEIVHEIESAMSMPGSFWSLCPWASTDGCTIMTKEVAQKLFEELHSVISSRCDSEMDNSDDLLCRVCHDVCLPMYVYKPLVCIQITQKNVEVGKSVTSKFLNDGFYHIQGVTRKLSDYHVDNSANRYQSNIGIQDNGEAKDDFCYKCVSSSKIMKQQTIAPIPKQKSVVILPRIDTTHRPQRGWL